MSLALRDADAEGGRKLLQHLLDSNVATMNEVPRFLKEMYTRITALLAYQLQPGVLSLLTIARKSWVKS